MGAVGGPGVSPGDTIAALASGAGQAGVAVIRISGPGVPQIVTDLIGLGLGAAIWGVQRWRHKSAGTLPS